MSAVFLCSLVEGADPNLTMDGTKRQTPLHAAAGGGHNEICHILVQVLPLAFMCLYFTFLFNLRCFYFHN